MRLSGEYLPAFTLVEVVLALFIGLLLLLGMNAVFKATSDTVRAGQELSGETRNGRAAQPILFDDLRNCAQDSPAFIISSAIVPQYLNAADATAANAQPGTLPPDALSGCTLGNHLHRADSLMFFARGLFKRKTADSPYLTSTTTSDEAYIHYGHLRVAKDGITYIRPDDYAGPSEPYASDWVLGRNVILLADGTYVLNTNAKDLGGGGEFYYETQSPPPPPWNHNATAGAYPSNVSPLGYGSVSTSNAANPAKAVQSSRYDLAGTTVDEFRAIVTNAATAQAFQTISPTMAYYFWWAPLVYTQFYTGLNNTAAAPYPWPGAPYPNTPVVPAPSAAVPNPFPRNRFNATNILSPNPMSSQDQANLAPYLLEHVSQFIVEYAGDFVTQDNNGNVTDTVPDGQIDWVYATKGDWNNTASYSAGDWVIYNGSYYQAQAGVTLAVGTAPANPAWLTGTPPRAIRWYGMPRDVTGSGHVPSFYGIANNNANELNNVVPLADVWLTSSNNNTRPLPYETETGPTLLDPAQTTSKVKDYATSAVTSPLTGLSPQARYTAVWRNDVPTMVRIVIKVDDPNNAVQDGPWFEYVFKLK